VGAAKNDSEKPDLSLIPKVAMAKESSTLKYFCRHVLETCGSPTEIATKDKK